MAITINTNVTSMIAQRNLDRTSTALAGSMERLSSGLRINSAKDDAAGFAIAQNINKEMKGLEQGIRNANDGISMIQVTEGALNEVGNNLQRMRELAVQASSGTYSAANRSSMQIEFSALRSEIDRVADTANFNNIKVLDGSNSSVNIQVGTANSANDRLKISLTDTNVSALGISANTLTSASGAQSALTSLDTAISKVNSARAQNGADQARFETAVRSNTDIKEKLAAAKSRIMDVDFAKESAEMTKNNILSQAGTTMLAQANSTPQLALSLLG